MKEKCPSSFRLSWRHEPSVWEGQKVKGPFLLTAAPMPRD